MSVAVQKLDGVESAEVSLNAGRVTIRLAPVNAITLSQIRTAIRNQGFSPRAANVTLSGSIETGAGGLTVRLPQGAVFALESNTGIESRLSRAVGTSVVIRGTVEADEDRVTPDMLTVEGLKAR